MGNEDIKPNPALEHMVWVDTNTFYDNKGLGVLPKIIKRPPRIIETQEDGKRVIIYECQPDGTYKILDTW